MERILLAINSRKIDEQAVRFACHLSKLTNSLLTGIFLENVVLEETVTVMELEGRPIIESVYLHEKPETDEERLTKKENLLRFAEITEELGVRATVHTEKGIPADDIIAESRFADIVVVDAATSFAKLEEGSPSRFVKDILQQAECPVIISPQDFTGIESITFCYDGGKSSAFAIKQFTHLFPELRNKRARLFYLVPPNELSLHEQMAVVEWLKFHYKDIEMLSIEDGGVSVFYSFLERMRNEIIVMGTYGRGLLASFFSDKGDGVTKGTTSLPLFISHY